MTGIENDAPARDGETPGRRAIPSAVGTALTALSLFVIALIPRLNAVWLGFVTADEPFWVYSSIRFVRALGARRWADTFQASQPGVITLWLGTLGIWWQRWRDAAAAEMHLAWVDHVTAIAPQNGALYSHLVPFLPTARVAVAVLTSLGLVGIYLLLRRLSDGHVALLAGVLLALDPFAAGYSGLLHVDAPAATFATLSLLAWLLALQQDRLLPALLSGLCAGCAMLNKPTSGAIALLVGLSALLWIPRAPRRAGRGTLLVLLWLVAAVTAVTTLYPAMWADPPGTARQVGQFAAAYLAGKPESTFFLGHSSSAPGPWFYPVVLGLRLTPVSLLGLLLSLPVMLIRPAGDPERKARIGLHLWLWAFVVGYTALITLGAPKAEHELLPVWPALTLLAASGWVSGARWLARLPHRGPSRAPAPSQLAAPVFAIVLVVLAIGQGMIFLLGWPYCLDAYNPLAGGLQTALRTLPVGQGEGLEQMARYINQQRNAEDLVVAGGGPITLGPLFKGQTLPLSDRSRRLADLVLITAHDRQTRPGQVADLLAGTRLVHTVNFGATEALWLYEVEDRAEEEHLALYAAPSDLILVDAQTCFLRRGQVENVELLESADEAQIVEQLDGWSRSYTRLWYISYPIASPLTAPILRRQLDTYAILLDQVDLGYATATLYILPSEPAFAAAPDAFHAANLGGQIALTGGAQLGEPPRAGKTLSVRLRWQALASPHSDYQVFIYLLDERGHPRAGGQVGELLIDDRFWPTSAWQPGEGTEQDYTLALPPALAPGRYQLAVGLFDAAGGDWLPALNEAGEEQGTGAAVLMAEVAASESPASPETLSLDHPLRANWADRVRLLGYSHPDRFAAGEVLAVELGWQGINTAGQDYQVHLRLVDKGGAPLHEQDFSLAAYPTSLWRPEEVLHEWYDLELPAELPAGTHTLTVQVLDATGEPLGPNLPLGSIEVLAAVSDP